MMEWSLGKALKKARIDTGISQRELARRTGLRQSHLSLIENDRHDPSATIVRTLAQALGVSSDYLLDLTDDPRPRPRRRRQGDDSEEEEAA